MKITASVLECIPHGTLQDLPGIDCEHLVRLEIVKALQELELETQVMDIDAQELRSDLALDHPQEVEIFLPRPSNDCHDVVYLELPDIHYRLVYIRQSRRLDIESADSIDISLTLASVRIPSRSALTFQVTEQTVVNVLNVYSLHFFDASMKSSLDVLLLA